MEAFYSQIKGEQWWKRLSNNQLRYITQWMCVFDEKKKKNVMSGLEKGYNGIYTRLHLKGLGPNSLECTLATSIRLDSLNDA